MPAQYYHILLGAQPQLVEMQNLLRRKLPEGAVFNDPATFHITLVYIEDDKGAPALNFDDLAAELPAFGVGASYLTTFPTPQNTELVLRVEDSPQLTYLQSAIYYRAQAAGMKISEYSYPQRWRCHITLATIPSPNTYSPSSDVYLNSSIHLEVRSFGVSQEESYVPTQTWALRGEIPIQEFLDRLKPNVESQATTLQLQEQVAAQNGRTEITLTCISEMKGGYPNIALPQDVDTSALQQQGRKFVTLPIGQVDAKSRNNRTYRRKALEEMVQQINDKRPEGGWGHIPDEHMGTAYGPPAIRWLAAQMDKNGMVWGKGLPLTEEAQRYFDDARMTNARVGTSLHAYVSMEGDNVEGMELIRLDLADPARVGVPITAARPQLSTEMADEDRAGVPVQPPEAESSSATPQTSKETNSVTDSNEELTALKTEKRTLNEQIATHEKTIKEQKRSLDDAADIYRILELKGDDPVKAARTLKEQYDEMVAENSALLDKALGAMIVEQVKVESVRPIVIEMVRDQKPITEKALNRAIADVLARPSVKELLAAGLKATMGPNQTGNPAIPARTPEDGVKKHLEEKPEVSHA